MQDGLALLHTAREWQSQGQGLWLIHVVRTWGSSPRPAGSLMLLAEDGRHMGSVSGGCVEGDLFQRLEAGDLSRDTPSLIEYSNEATPQVRLPCRSRLQLVVEPVLGSTD
ncbi:MAG: XdhC family protein, partial [Gammaproteobacteria bacterium]|nr:XdhC family protein [Gammaproteobacteria bacterium]